MLPSLSPLHEIYRMNHQLFTDSFKDMPDADICGRIDGKGNSMLWLAGHITGSRHMLANLLRVNDEFPYAELFGRGVEAIAVEEYPPLSELKKLWEDISGKIYARMEEATDEEMQTPSPITFPTQEDTILAAAALLSLHESYHIGQMAYIRRLAGHSRLVG